MFTKEELMAMPLKRLRQIDVFNLDDEALLQEVISEKEKAIIPDVPIKMSDIPDIKTPQEEAGWQKVVDKRVEAIRPEVEVKADNAGIEIKVENKIEKVKCDVCGKEYKNAFAIKMHKARFHK